MTFYKTLFLTVISICLFSCKKDKLQISDNIIKISNFPEKGNVVFKNLFDYKEGTPCNIHVLDSTLVIDNLGIRTKFKMFNYSLTTGELSKGYFSKGRGPYEFLSSYSSGITANHLWVHDMALKKIIRIDKKDIFAKNKDSIVFNEFKFKTHTAIRAAMVDSLSYYGASNLLSKYKVAKMDLKSDTIIKEFGEFKNIPENLPVELLKSVYSCRIQPKPSGDKIVLAYSWSNTIEIFNIADTKESIVVEGPEDYDHIDYTIGENNVVGATMIRTVDTRIAFCELAVTDNYIYTLYSGTTEKEDGDNFGTALSVYVYDWNGNPIKELTLNTPIRLLSVSKDDKTMYTYNESTGYIMEAYLN